MKVRGDDVILGGKLEHSQVRPVTMRLFVSEKNGIFPYFIDEIGCFGIYLGRRCGCLWARLGMYYMILGGQSVVLHSKFIRLGGRVKHI